MIKGKDILLDSSPILREKCEDVAIPLSKKDKKLAFDLLGYVKYSVDEELQQKHGLKPAVGIAAVQIGILKKILAIHYPIVDPNDSEKEIIVEHLLANAKIIGHSIKQAYLLNGEGCLSVELEHQGFVYRHNKIKVRAYDILQEKEVVFDAYGYDAIVLQHEIDHYHGILFYDHIDKNNPFKIVENSVEI